MGRKLRWIVPSLLILITLMVFSGAVLAEEEETENSFSVGPLELEAESAYLLDAATGLSLYGISEHERRAPASMTKIATMILVFEAVQSGEIAWDEEVVVSPRASGMGGSQVYLEAGEKMMVKDLLKAVAVSSANDASVALAEYISGSHEAFVGDMNELVERLGLTNTHFINAHGLDNPEHYSSAHDMAHLGRHLVTTYPQVLEYTSIWTDWLREDTDRPFWLTNTNRMIRQYPGVDGLKTGLTDESMWCLTATAKSNGTRLIVTVMGAPTSDARFDSVATLLNAGFAAVETIEFAQTGDVLGSLPVSEGEKQEVDVTVARDAEVTIPRGRAGDLVGDISLIQQDLKAPVSVQETVGQLQIRLEGELLQEIPLVPVEVIERCGIGTIFVRMLQIMWLLN